MERGDIVLLIQCLTNSDHLSIGRKLDMEWDEDDSGGNGRFRFLFMGVLGAIGVKEGERPPPSFC